MTKRLLTTYRIHTGKLTRSVDFAVVSDLHDEAYDDLWPLLEGADALLVPGDVCDRYRQSSERGAAFLREAARRMPTFFSVGNHETRQKDYRQMMQTLEATGAQVLVNRYVRFGECWIGGWYPPEIVREADMLDSLEAQEGVKVLLCHKPEHYIQYMRGRALDLVVAGHAHGGQIRIAGRGLYSPGQGILPRYTRGVVDGRLVISAGVGNPVRLPRWGNPCEVLRVTLE